MPRAARFLMMLGAVFFTLPAFSAETAMPRVFHFYIGGYTGTSYTLDVKGRRLVYSTGHSVDAKSVRRTLITATQAQWAQFDQALEDIGVWQWGHDYSDTNIGHGAQWTLEISLGDRAVKTFGSNQFPPGFDALLNAMETLTGKSFHQPESL